VRGLLPHGSTLDDATFERRHLFLCWVLALHLPGLLALGLWRQFDPVHLGLELAAPAACVVFARLAADRRVASFFVVAGLVYCSTVLVHLSGGAIEAHFHFFVLIGLVALYQDWVPFLWNVALTVLVHGVGGAVEADLLFSHDAGHARPWVWAAVHGAAVLAACGAQVAFWKSTEEQQEHNVELASTLATSDAQQRQSTSELLVNLARRNQSLLNRQLEIINDLELRDHDPAVLDELAQLDHLATRIRRNAESLLVLAGDEPSRRWGTPVPLARVVRSAVGEVEDHERIEVVVNNHIEIAGRAVADLAHLLTELIENATTFSPPGSTVRVRSQLAPDRPTSTVISVEDQGIGMPQRDLEDVNALLAEAPEVDLGRSTMLGFHVIARLARRHGVTVRLAATPGGGLTAMVTLPEDMVSERLADAPVATPGADRTIAPWVGPDGGRLARLHSLAPFGGPADRVQPPAPAALPQGPSTWREPEVAIPEPAPIALPAASAPPPDPVPDLPAMTPPSWWFESESFLHRPAGGAITAPATTGAPIEAPLVAPPPGTTPLAPAAAAAAAPAEGGEAAAEAPAS
jgi:signal transduction histidine kinase